MNYFEGFHKKSILVIPPHHELRKRTAKRNEDMGQAVPDDAINAMKGEGCVCVISCWIGIYWKLPEIECSCIFPVYIDKNG